MVQNLLFPKDSTFFDFFMYKSLKKIHYEKRFGSNEEVISSKEAYLEDLSKSFYNLKTIW